MNATLIRALGLMVLMVAASVTAHVLRPDVRMADENHKTDYASKLPQQFGDWTLSRNEPAPVVNPQEQELLDSLYTEIVAHTYVHRDGRKIMLSLAYGDNQSHGSQIHKPEVCYPAQGFIISGLHKHELQTAQGTIPAMRLVAVHGMRVEPVTYWIRVGNSVVRGAVEQNLARVRYGLQGYIPDGLLFRVSEIAEDPQQSFELQRQFIDDLLRAVDPQTRAALMGKPA